jgi:hypothetical protein
MELWRTGGQPHVFFIHEQGLESKKNDSARKNVRMKKEKGMKVFTDEEDRL